MRKQAPATLRPRDRTAGPAQRRQALPGRQREIEQEGNVLAAGINCLNESHFSDTTPCLAWNMLYEEQGLMWGCEADTLSMLTETLLHRVAGRPADDDQPVPLPDGPGRHQARAHPRLPAGGAARELHPGRPLRLPGRGAALLFDGMDAAPQGAGDRGRERHRHRRPPARGPGHPGQAGPDDGDDQRGRGRLWKAMRSSRTRTA